MAELISFLLLAGLALWGYGCHCACNAREERSLPSQTEAPQAAPSMAPTQPRTAA